MSWLKSNWIKPFTFEKELMYLFGISSSYKLSLIVKSFSSFSQKEFQFSVSNAFILTSVDASSYTFSHNIESKSSTTYFISFSLSFPFSETTRSIEVTVDWISSAITSPSFLFPVSCSIWDFNSSIDSATDKISSLNTVAWHSWLFCKLSQTFVESSDIMDATSESMSSISWLLHDRFLLHGKSSASLCNEDIIYSTGVIWVLTPLSGGFLFVISLLRGIFTFKGDCWTNSFSKHFGPICSSATAASDSTSDKFFSQSLWTVGSCKFSSIESKLWSFDIALHNSLSIEFWRRLKLSLASMSTPDASWYEQPGCLSSETTNFPEKLFLLFTLVKIFSSYASPPIIFTTLVTISSNFIDTILLTSWARDSSINLFDSKSTETSANVIKLNNKSSVVIKTSSAWHW